jgi:hypothetical protein
MQCQAIRGVANRAPVSEGMIAWDGRWPAGDEGWRRKLQDSGFGRKDGASNSRIPAREGKMAPQTPGCRSGKKDGGPGRRKNRHPGKMAAREARIGVILERWRPGKREKPPSWKLRGPGSEKRLREAKNGSGNDEIRAGASRCPSPQSLSLESRQQSRGPAGIDRDRRIVVIGRAGEEGPVGAVVEAAVDAVGARRGI